MTLRWSNVLARSAVGSLLAGSVVGCSSPPPSQFPTARDAIDRMHATYECSRGLGGEAKVDYVGDEGRIRGNVLFNASRPEQVRFDVFSPFGVTISTLTSDGKAFTLFDLKEKTFLKGPAKACNVARFTGVPVPPHVLVPLLGGEAPVLVHEPQDASIEWESGSYVIRIAGRHGASQRICLEPRPEDWERPWQEQRIRVTEVAVEQKGVELYEVELNRHRSVKTSRPLKDEDGLGDDIPPSGPPCDTEVPHGLRIEVPTSGRDVIFQYQEVHHNPPLTTGTFTQPTPPGVKVRYADCES